MIYPGNTALSAAVKDRVVSTFQHTLTLFKQGRLEEVGAGCNLILQMDPAFDPARKLLEKMKNPAAPIDVDALLPGQAAAQSRDPLALAREAMAARDFQRVIHLTSQILSDDMLNDEARILGDEAREKLEAAPFVEQFTRKCDASLAAGNLGAAKLDLEKARALDPTHPEVVRVGQALAQAGPAKPPAPPPSPSFVVDDVAQSPAAGRSAAQASDFGFTFEEDKAAAPVSFENFSFDTPAAPAQPAAPVTDFSSFSFDSPSAPAAEPPFASFSFDTPATAPPEPPAPPPATGAQEFDFATASVVTNADEQKKIDQYLSDGDRAFEGGDYQQAIDLWSRIFLIDVTNDVASDRIERAKAKRREIEQKAESILASGIQAFERGDTARAHADLSEVLRLDPHNATAQDYLDRLGETLPAGGAAPRVAPPDEKLELGFFEDEPLPGGFEAPLVPPEPGAASAAAPSESGRRAAVAATPKAARTGRKLPMGLLAGLLAVILLAGGGWFVWSRFMSAPEADPSVTQATFDRASMLVKAGKYDQAIALLQDIKPGDPQHDKALVMIADLQQKKAGAAAVIDGVPADMYYAQKVDAARTALAAHDFSGAKAAFEQALRVKPLPADLKAQYDTASQQVAKLDAAKALFAERKYSEAISNLQQLLEQDPQNQNIRRLIMDAHFNVGATALQEERTADALREFDEVLKVNPNDELAKRSRELAVRYEGQPKDLLYRIYVKYLPLRQAT